MKKQKKKHRKEKLQLEGKKQHIVLQEPSVKQTSLSHINPGYSVKSKYNIPTKSGTKM